jgi:hypothetical protein
MHKHKNFDAYKLRKKFLVAVKVYVAEIRSVDVPG